MHLLSADLPFRSSSWLIVSAWGSDHAVTGVVHRFEFPLELDMYRYTKESMEAAEAAAESAAAAEPPTVPELAPVVTVPEPDTSAPVDGQSANTPQNCSYELRGIVVHSGTANAGHYYSYAKVGGCASPKTPLQQACAHARE